MNDGERSLQVALRERAELVTADNLKHRQLLEPDSAVHSELARRKMLFPALAGAMVIALVAIGVSMLRSSSSAGHHTQPGSMYAARSFYIGKHWTLAEVSHNQRHQQVPVTLRSGVEFLANGELNASDGVNTLSGHYRSSKGGVVISNAGSTLALYAGNDSAQKAAISGLAAIVFGGADGQTGAAPSRVQITRDGANLVLTGGGYQLTFTAAGPASPGPSEVSSTTG